MFSVVNALMSITLGTAGTSCLMVLMRPGRRHLVLHSVVLGAHSYRLHVNRMRQVLHPAALWRCCLLWRVEQMLSL
jgi:hypothetical protein